MRSLIQIPGRPPLRTAADKHHLPLCPANSKNCVCSRDADPLVKSWKIKVSAPQDLQTIKKFILQQPRTALVEEIVGQYLHTTFASEFFGFVDDVEFAVAGQMIDVRSASRVGKADFGVNLRRIHMLTEQLGY